MSLTFTEKVKKAFLSLDKNHLPDERNLNVKDLGNMITGHFGKANGIQIYGGNKKIIVLNKVIDSATFGILCKNVKYLKGKKFPNQ